MSGSYRFGIFELDARAGELRRNGLRVKIEDQPLRMLAALVERAGELMTREELRVVLWPDGTHVELDNSLARIVNKVRSALGDEAGNPRFIETLPRRGYRFVAPVSRVGEPAADAGPPPEPAPAPAPGRRWWQAAAAVASLAAVAAVLGLQPKPGVKPSSVAVLPFQSHAPDPRQSFLADAVTDQLISALSGVRPWRVISRTSVLRYKGAHAPLPQIASELKVDAVVEGAIAMSHGRAQITARLVSVPAERLLWSRTYERDGGNVLGVEADIARDLAAHFGGAVDPARLAARPQNAGAAELYAQGRLFVNEPGRESIERGIEALERAIRLDPRHAGAWAAIADGWFSMSSVYLPPAEAMPKATAAARKAVELAPELDAGHAALGRIHVFYDWDWDAAGAELRRALELNPNSVAAYRGLAFLHLAKGELEASRRAIGKALEIDPMSLWSHFQSAFTLNCMRRYAEAEQEARRMLAWEPRFGMLRAALALSYQGRGRHIEAVSEMERGVREHPIPTTTALLAQVYAQAGRTADAERRLAELTELSKRQYVCPYEVGQAYLALGRKQTALDWLERAASDRADCMLWLRAEPWMDPIRDDPRYARIVRQVGYPNL